MVFRLYISEIAIFNRIHFISFSRNGRGKGCDAIRMRTPDKNLRLTDLNLKTVELNLKIRI